MTTQELKKAIFLDVDGVLHRMREEIVPFEHDCMQCLRQIIDSTGAEIVLSSSWRCAPESVQQVNDALSQFGINNCISITPIKGFRSRVAEICYWLKHNPVATYVALDDMDLRTGPGGKGLSSIASNFVQTNPTTGLTSEDSAQAIAILNGADVKSSDVGSDTLDALMQNT